MKIAIIGGGISGLVSAYHLSKDHDITVFEANDYPGGHTNTVDVERNGGQYAVDTGFIVFNDRTYPNFIRLLDELGVESQPTTMSFSVACEATGLEYRGADFAGLFAQKRNLFNLKYYRLLYDIVRFNRDAKALLNCLPGSSQTVGEFIEGRYSNAFVNQYLLPMGSAVWSCPCERFCNFPVDFIAEFFENHGLLNISDRPQWRVIKGGSRQYVKKLIARFSERIVLNAPVSAIRRSSDAVRLFVLGHEQVFDHVVFACHADQALRILGSEATAIEKELLSAFPYEKNIATLHTQASVLPSSRNAWAAWNYFKPIGQSNKATVTYNMNILQSLDMQNLFNVTLNDHGRIESDKVIDEFVYHHPTFDIRRKLMQSRHAELINQRNTSFCGAYWGNGFHEDGVTSALAVTRALQELPAHA
jgi:predicted NAD/FAD-binding protein